MLWRYRLPTKSAHSGQSLMRLRRGPMKGETCRNVLLVAGTFCIQPRRPVLRWKQSTFAVSFTVFFGRKKKCGHVGLSCLVQGQRPCRRDESSRGFLCEKRGRSAARSSVEKGQAWRGTKAQRIKDRRILSSSSRQPKCLHGFWTNQENSICHDASFAGCQRDSNLSDSYL